MNKGFRITEETPDREYFTIIPNYIINHSTIWERDIYLVMKRIAGEKGNCWASHQTIAEKTGVSRPTVSRTIQKLLKRGWIEEEGRVPGKTHPTKKYAIVDLWKENIDYYQDQKKRKPQNQSSENTKDTSTTEPKIRKPQIHKEDHIKEDPIIMSKDITAAEPQTGITRIVGKGNRANPDINYAISYLKEKLGLPLLDGSVKQNRRYCWLALKKFKGIENITLLIDALARNEFWRTKIASFQSLYYKGVQIISETRVPRKGGTIIVK